MKNVRKYSLLSFLTIFLLIIIVFVYKYVPDKKILSPVKSIDKALNKIPLDSTVNADHAYQLSNLAAIDKFAEEISREICKQERTELWQLTDPPKEDIKLNVPMPIDANFGPNLSPGEAIAWLKRSATSKCSSFKKSIAEQYYSKIGLLNKDNYKTFYQEFNRIHQERRGFADYKLIRKSLQALEAASPTESKLLRDAILYAVNTQINDSSNIIDLLNASKALRMINEKGLISYPTNKQIDDFDEEISKIMQDNIQKGQRHNKEFFPSSVDFSKITEEEMLTNLGHRGVKDMIDIDREEYEVTIKMARRLQEFLGRNF